MNEIISQLVVTIPAAVAVIVVVMVFMKFLEGERATRKEAMDACHATHRGLQESAQKTLDLCNQAIRECAQKHGEVAEALRVFRGGR
jgi:hypothetical protein